MQNALNAAAAEGWYPHQPGFAEIPEVRYQTGCRPTVYVMRKVVGPSVHYRDCSPAESSDIETRDIMKDWKS